MSIHGDDVVRAIRRGLSDTCPSQTEAFYTPIEDGRGWPNRDGHWRIDTVGRDWLRSFRITVEAISVGAVKGELGDAFEPDGSFRVEKEETL